MKQILLLLIMCVSLSSESVFSQSWGLIAGVDTLVVKQGLSGIASIHGNADRVFLSSLKADLSTELFYSDDGGMNWQESETNDNAGSYSLFSNNSDTEIYAWGTTLFGVRNIKKSTDNGATWTVKVPESTNFPFFFLGAHLASIGDTLIVTSTARDVGMLKSVDGGINWEVFDAFSDGDGNKAIQSVFSDSKNFYLLAGSNGEGLFKSHRDSTSWTKIYPETDVKKSVDKALITKQGRIVVAHSLGLDFSDDSGETWIEKSREELEIGLSGSIAKMVLLDDKVVLSIQDGSEVKSRILLVNSDFSGSIDISNGLIEYERGTEFNFLVSTNTQLFGTRLGELTEMWSYGDVPSGTSREEENFREEFVLSQNYPNPFNPSTNISFTLPAAGEITLKVYNLLGQEVASLVNGRVASGNHTVAFDASRLSSGMYIYRLQTGGFSQTKKMLLIK